jgi:phosphatidylinositol glycan class C protein
MSADVRLDIFSQGSSDAITCILTVAWAASAMYMAAAHSTTVAGLLLAILISISFVGPAVLVWAQKFKKYVQPQCNVETILTCLLSELRGPWDVAVPRIN